MRNENGSEGQVATVRLNRYLAQCGLGSRRACDTLISAGRIYVNAQKVAQLGTKILPGRDSVSYKGKTLEPVRVLEYIAYNKPRGLLVTRFDPEGRTTIYDALMGKGSPVDHLKYVGRLDMYSEGLLLLTNDGALIHALTHPRFHIKKVYHVEADKSISAPDLTRLIETGVESEGQLLHAGAIRSVHGLSGGEGREHWYEIDLYEGKKRQIRRMLETCGYRVLRLRRVRFGSVSLGTLNEGEIRDLTKKELMGLMNSGYR